MTRLERIAHDLAAVLSPHGEADWPRHVPMAEEVGTRLVQQFPQIMSPDAESLDRHSDRRGKSQRICAPPDRRM
jgi:hypothetical protein